MRTRTVVLAAVAALVLAAAGGVATAQNTSNDTTADNTTVDNVTSNEADADVQLSFGEQISILVANHQTEVSHTVENAAFEIAFERNPEAAVRNRAQELREKLERARQKKEEIEQKVESGEMSERRAMVEKAKLSMEAEAVNSSADSVLDRAAERGINVSAIETLKQNASQLSGQEVSRIARSIAGPGVAEDRRPERAGPPRDLAPEETSGEEVNDTGEEMEQPEDDGDDTEYGEEDMNSSPRGEPGR